jgi:hypothetical protein
MFRPATLHSELPTDALLIEEVPQNATEVEKFIKALNPKSALQKIGLAATTGNFILYPILFANFMRIFWQVQSTLQTELDNNLYYRCEILPDIRTAISYDGATLRAEGAGLTTTSAGIGALIALIAAQYQLVRYFTRKNQISQIKVFTQRTDAFIKFLRLNNPDYENKIRAYLLDTPLDKLNVLLEKDRNKKGLNLEIMQEIQNLGNRFEKFADDMAWFRGEVNTSYLMPIIGMSTIPAFIVTFIAAYNLSKESSCSTFPLIAYLSDTCDVSEQYQNLSLLTYFWDVLSVTGLSVYCGVLIARFITAYPSLQGLRARFYEHVHQKYFQNNPDDWVYRKLTWRVASTIFTPVILTYSFLEALHLANNYLAEMNCPRMGSLIWSIYTDNVSDDPFCPASEKSMAIAGFLGDFEIVKVDFLLFMLTFLSYLGTFLFEKYGMPDYQDLSDEEKTARDNNFKSAKTILAKLDAISNLSWDFAIGACIIIGMLQFFPIKKFADSILHHDLETFDDLHSILPSNMTFNNTLPQLLSAFCPFDNLTAIFLEQAGNLTQFNISDLNITQFINMTLPIRLIDNTTLAFQIAPACPQQEIASVYFHNIAGINSTCDPLLETRAIGGFVGPYWLGISFVSGGVYMLATASQLFTWGVISIKKCFSKNKSTIPEPEEDNEDDDDALRTAYHELPANDIVLAKHRSSIFYRPPLPSEQTNNTIIGNNATFRQSP